MRNWSHLIPFVTAARESSFRKAAGLLGVTPGAISQNIAQFEKRLGFALFYRTTREVRLTDAGLRLFEMVQRQVQELDHSLSLAQEMQREPSGTVRVGAFPAFGRRWLVPIFSSFRRIYPGINLDIFFSHDLSESDELDIVIRNGIPAGAHFNYHEVIEMRSVLVASPDYLSRRGIPRSVEELASHTNILLDSGEGPMSWQYRNMDQVDNQVAAFSKRYLPVPQSSDRVILRGQVDIMRDMVLLGMGVSMFQDKIISDDIANGNLVVLLQDKEFCQGNPSLHKIYVGHRGEGRMTNREQLLLKHIIDGLSHTCPHVPG